jgi:hypothetical protein
MCISWYTFLLTKLHKYEIYQLSLHIYLQEWISIGVMGNILESSIIFWLQQHFYVKLQ